MVCIRRLPTPLNATAHRPPIRAGLTRAVRRVAAALALAFASANAMAQWVHVNSNDDSTLYADPTSTRRVGDLATIWGLYQYRSAKTVDGQSYRSDKFQYEFDCKTKLLHILAFSWHSGNMGEGAVVRSVSVPDAWQPVAPNSYGELMWKLACPND